MALTAPPVNQLLFAGNNLLFFKANKEGAKEVYHLLESYAKASSQRGEDSYVFFSKGCPGNEILIVKNVLRV